jgi:alkylation response protein AidB-like acyl-CoA dehydrogenase
VVLVAAKSWVTSAGEADSYVWTSRPSDGSDGASLWLVPADADGLTVAAPFDGFGLRGNASSPIDARGVRLPATARLGADGAGLDIALGVVLPVFQVLNASCSLGLMDAGIAKAVAHVTSARLEHLGQTLADQPVTRQHLADMRNRADAADALVQDAIAALATGRPDAPLRMLQSKAVAGETALAVLDVAMRVGGGAAFRKDVGIERHFRDARASAVMAPTVDALREFTGRAMCGMPLFG